MTKQKTPMVLLSGLLCDQRIWQPVADQLTDVAECHIFSFAGFDSIEAMASHVLENSPGKFALAGHSMGGRVALEVYKQAPHRITHLALLNTGVHPKRDSEVPGRRKLLDLADAKGMHDVCEAWLPPMMGPEGLQDDALMADLTNMVTSHTPAQFNGEIQALLNRPEAESVLASVVVNTLLLSSEHDAWSPISQHREMQALVPQSILVAIDGAGHMSTVEAPQAVADAMRQWLKQ